MSRVKSKNTGPEILVRKFIFSKGMRYSLHDSKLPGCPDIILRKYNTVLQVRGCFWHKHKCKQWKSPKTRKTYWENKLNQNVRRDANNDMKIRKMGWNLIVLWECEVKKSNFFQIKGNKMIMLIKKNIK